ncbi:hypothetical protein BKH46_08040 [Helicobacter sp. 12S02634-8]|uniref:TraG/VirB4 family ATPase n=1 Tax=Helicobacter sp. 12S02634-8 TaxID=1476199 RepID=UPI000BA5CE01|nr:EAL domain-containing protein [Helicobacter sp. 12S02634-8]PAF46327.1 hypothetical protein BKH46_08040 [Helicobacter sp. 12S02634-8]
MKYLLYFLLAALAFGFVFYVRSPKRMKKLLPQLKKIWEVVVPFEWTQSLASLTPDRIKALNHTDSISSQLLLESYRPVDDEIGFFNLITGRIGIGFEVSPPSILTEDMLKGIKSTLNAIDIKDVAVQFITYASTDLSNYLAALKECATCDSGVGNTQALLKLRDDRIKKTKQWSKSTMLSKESGADLRARNFINMVLILFPEETPESKIRSLYYTIKGSIKELEPRSLSPKTIAKVYGEILKEDSSLGDYDVHKKMNTQLAKGARIRINPDDGLIEIGKKTYAKVLTTQKWPKYTDVLNMMDAFFPIDGDEFQIPLPSPFYVSMTVHIDNPEKVKSKILSKARANVNNSSKINRKMSLMNPKVQETIDESLRTIEYFEKYEQKPYQAMYTIAVFEENKDRLNTAIGRLKTRAADVNMGGWKIQEEEMGITALQTLLWSLPFQFDLETKQFLNRFDLMFNSNVMSIIPLIASFKGIGDPVLRFFARTGQCVGIDFWASQNNYNACIIGPSGSGKSFLSNSIQASHLQAGVKLTIFDKGKSYLPLCQELKGEFISFEEFDDSGKPNKKCLNFFTNLVTKPQHKDTIKGDKVVMNYASFSVDDLAGIDGMVDMIDEDFFQPLIIIVGIMCGQDFTPGIRSDNDSIDNANRSVMMTLLQEAVKTAFYRRGREAGMREVGEALSWFKKEAEVKRDFQSVEIISQLLLGLAAYIYPGGEFYEYFNGSCNVDIKNDFCLLELDELTRKGNLYDLVVMFMLEQCIVDMYLDRSKKKSIVIDEAASILKKEFFAAYLEDLARRIRKYGGSLITITQDDQDYNANASSKSVWTNASHKFMLAMDPSNINRGFSDGGLFVGWSDFIRRQMLSVKNRAPEYSEVLYVYAGRFSEILLLKATHQEGAMFTTKATEISYKKELQKKYNLTPQDATSMFAYMKEGLPTHEILEILKGEDNSANTEYWMGKIRKAVNGDTITPYCQKIVDKDGGVVFYETFLRLLVDGEVFTPKDFLETAVEQDLLNMITKIHIQKCASFFIGHNATFSINLHESEISSHLLEMLDEIMGEHKELLILEIPSSGISNKDTMDFCEDAKNRGYLIAIDNVSFDIDLGVLDEISPHIIKINGILINSALKDETKRRKLKVLPDLARALDIQVSASHIENKEVFRMTQGFGVHFFQGNYFAEPMDIFEGYEIQVKED